MLDPKRHMEFHERQNRAFDALLKVACSCVPSGWRSAVLELDVAYDPFTNRRAIKHRLRDLNGGADVTDLPESLFFATTELHSIFSEYEQAWKHSAVTLSFDEHGRMREAKATYAYGS